MATNNGKDRSGNLIHVKASGLMCSFCTTTADRYFPSLGFTVTTRDAVPDDVRATAEFQGACPAAATVMTRALDQEAGARA